MSYATTEQVIEQLKSFKGYYVESICLGFNEGLHEDVQTKVEISLKPDKKIMGLNPANPHDIKCPWMNFIKI